MKDDLKNLLENQNAKLIREQQFSGFSDALDEYATFTPSRIKYTSFEETTKMLRDLRAKAESMPPRSSTTFPNKHKLNQLTECLIDSLSNNSTFVILHDHFLFVGALELKLHDALRNIEGFFRIGEDMVVVIDKECKNYLTFEREQLAISGDSHYETRIGGQDWPFASEQCFER